jgi:hypothetical protein
VRPWDSVRYARGASLGREAWRASRSACSRSDLGLQDLKAIPRSVVDPVAQRNEGLEHPAVYSGRLLELDRLADVDAPQRSRGLRGLRVAFTGVLVPVLTGCGRACSGRQRTNR